MNRGKDICKELKAVRKRIAEENDIPLEIKECTYNGPCKGTCPRCESEVRYLEKFLAYKLKLGKVATVAGLALGLASCGGTIQGEVPSEDIPPEEIPPTDANDSLPQDAEQVPSERRENTELPVVGEIEVGGMEEESATQDEEEGALAGVIIEDQPEFPGGVEAMYKFLQENIKYPPLALENGIEGRVYVTFVVEEDGTITEPRVLRDIGGGCGREAIRVVKLMPKWKPGKQSGKPVRVQYNLPINFTLPSDWHPLVEGKASIETGQRTFSEDRTMGIPCDTSDYEIGPTAPTQQMEVDGVKVIVK